MWKTPPRSYAENMIEITNLTKRYGNKTAVNNISFTVEPGKITGFLGPNGAGKTTTMRMIMGLDNPTRGQVRINNKYFKNLKAPMSEIGALLDAKAMNTLLTASTHLKILAATHAIPKKRVEEVLELTGLEEVANKKIKNFSLGMQQRLGIAAALLANPNILIFDEPINGLDVDGILWFRRLLRSLSDNGKAVFLSSHLMSEMSQVADHIIVLGQGNILKNTPLKDFVTSESKAEVRVRTPQLSEFASLLDKLGTSITRVDSDVLEIQDLDAAEIGHLSLKHNIVLHELTPISRSLEDAYLHITDSAVEYRTER